MSEARQMAGSELWSPGAKSDGAVLHPSGSDFFSKSRITTTAEPLQWLFSYKVLVLVILVYDTISQQRKLGEVYWRFSTKQESLQL